MELGIFSKVYEGQPLQRVLPLMEKDIFQWVHINLETIQLRKEFDEIPPALAQNLSSLFSEITVRPASLSATYNMIHPDSAVRSSSLKRMAELVTLAGKSGIPYAAICTGTNNPYDMWAPHRDNHTAEAWRRLTSSLEQLLPVCEAANVRILIEPEQNNVVASPQDARRLLDELRSPFLGLIMDACNLMNAETIQNIPYTLGCAFDLLAEDIYLAHAKDVRWDNVRKEAVFVPAGQGTMDYPLYLSYLKALPRRCPILLHGLLSRDIPGCKAFIQAAMERAL